MVQWLRLCAPNAGVPGSIPGWGARSHINAATKSSHATTKIPHAATKTRCSGRKGGRKEGRTGKRERKKERERGREREKDRKNERKKLKENYLPKGKEKPCII